MPVKRTIAEKSGTYFITFTCYRWLPLIAEINGYDIVYNWFDHLKKKGHYINGYVIMPNHIHLLVSFVETSQTINTIIGNGKRFMAYEIVRRLKEQQQEFLLEQLQQDIERTRKENNKQHNVWELSFDWKQCRTKKFAWQKLNYIHHNPCAGKWSLAANEVAYVHSSARFYLTGEPGRYIVADIAKMMDVDFSATSPARDVA